MNQARGRSEGKHPYPGLRCEMERLLLGYNENHRLRELDERLVKIYEVFNVPRKVLLKQSGRE
ncbi:MAG: hypothetical protein PWP39_1019 [Pyrococcus sp.]|nr:hypothetical protein [Pyrococcus sp.]